MSEKNTLDLQRLGAQIDVILTEIYGKYVAKGSPTKLGGLRFLDVDCAKTFAFEKTQKAADGNLLMMSAPFADNKEDVEVKLKSGPHGELMREVIVRTSPDAGKKSKFFVEVAYFLDTIKWVTPEAVTAIVEAAQCTGNEAVIRLLKINVLPIAEDIMEHFIQIVRTETGTPPMAQATF